MLAIQIDIISVIARSEGQVKLSFHPPSMTMACSHENRVSCKGSFCRCALSFFWSPLSSCIDRSRWRQTISTTSIAGVMF